MSPPMKNWAFFFLASARNTSMYAIDYLCSIRSWPCLIVDRPSYDFDAIVIGNEQKDATRSILGESTEISTADSDVVTVDHH